jgi:peptidoglycan hydrolase-like protein with peptidoglycan-binding domain
VEQRTLEAKVVGRATVGTAAAVDIDCFPLAAGQSASATKQVFTRPSRPAGTSVAEGDLLAEVNGRPVLVLQGDTPSFREMGPGVKGADVAALQSALRRLGFSAGETDGTFGTGTESAVQAWYRSLGYEAAGPTKEEAERLEAARTATLQAENGQRQAQSALSKAAQPAPETDVLQARIALVQAQQQLNEASAARADTSLPTLQVQQARANLDQMQKGRDTSSERAALTAANAELASARSRHDALDGSLGTKVPFCEVVFVPSLPGAIDQPPKDGQSGQGQAGQGASQGAGTSTAWARVASGQLVLKASMSATEKSLLAVDMPVSYGDGQGPTGRGKISAFEAAGGAGTTQFRVTVLPDEALAASTLGQNVRMVATVKSTSGAVLAVPLAAVSATSDGSAKVTKVTPTGKVDVAVKAGLSADGFVEIEPMPAQALKAGENVAVGR